MERDEKTLPRETLLALWRNLPTPEGWQMDDIILQYAKLVASRYAASAEQPIDPLQVLADEAQELDMGYVAGSHPERARVDERRRCKACSAPRQGETCHKCGEPTFEPHPSWEEPALPPVDRIRELAREVGYAIGEHGTKERDLDLIAAPWTDEAVGNYALLEHIANGLGAKIIEIERKPKGRYAATLQMDGWFKSIDLSVCPAALSAQPADTAAWTDEQIVQIIADANLMCVHPTAQTTIDISRTIEHHLLAQRAPAQPAGKDAELVRLREIARLIGAIFVYGDFKAETYNERELEKLLREQGTFWESIHDYENSAAAPQQGSGKDAPEEMCPHCDDPLPQGRETCEECETFFDAAAAPQEAPQQDSVALNEWLEKTKWVQEQISTFPVSSLGKHRADVMREEIEQLRAKLTALGHGV